MRLLPGGVVLCLLLTIYSCTADKPPHIVFVLVDDMGWDDVGYHGSEIRTPHLDELAAGGVTLDQYYVQPICSPSRSQLLTGRYQTHLGNVHGIVQGDKPMGLPLEIPTLGDKLKEVGYSTHLVGKWHVGMFTPDFLPTRRGFDTFFGKMTGTGFHFNHTQCHTFDDERVCGLDLMDNEEPAWGVNEYSTELYTRKGIEIIDNHDPNEPLFLYMAYQAPHMPLEAPQDYIDMYAADIADPNRQIYAGMVTALDDGIRDLTDTLKARGLWEDTILIFSSDNGANEYFGGSNAPLRGHKGCLFEGGIRVPGFVHGERLADRAGTVSQQLVHISDWYPTLVTLAGGSVEGERLDGHDVWEHISRGTPSPRKEILHGLDILMMKKGEDMYPGNFDTRNRAAIRSGDWKLLTGRPDASGRPGGRKKKMQGERGPPPSEGPGRDALTGDDGIRERPEERNPLPTETDDTTRGPRNSRSAGQRGTRPDRWMMVPRAPEEPEDKNVWLFNITADPNEQTDLSEQHPEVVQQLLERLVFHLSTAVPPVSPCPDPRANPKLHNNTWGPWLESGQEGTIDPICDDLKAMYEEFRYKPEDYPRENAGPGTILLVFIIVIFCVLLFSAIFAGRKYLMRRKKQLQLEVNMDHE